MLFDNMYFIFICLFSYLKMLCYEMIQAAECWLAFCLSFIKIRTKNLVCVGMQGIRSGEGVGVQSGHVPENETKLGQQHVSNVKASGQGRVVAGKQR